MTTLKIDPTESTPPFEQLRRQLIDQIMSRRLPAGTKLVNATWDKDSSLWYVVRPMRADEEPEESTMKEDSTFGAMQGTVIFIESR